MAWHKFGHLCKSVTGYKDAVISLQLWQGNDEVCCNYLPWSVWYHILPISFVSLICPSFLTNTVGFYGLSGTWMGCPAGNAATPQVSWLLTTTLYQKHCSFFLSLWMLGFCNRMSCAVLGHSFLFSPFPLSLHVLRTLFPYSIFFTTLSLFCSTVTSLHVLLHPLVRYFANPVFLFWSVILHCFSPFTFCSTFHLKAAHGSHQGSSSSCVRWCDHGIMHRHCILRCIAVHLFGIVWASGLLFKDTMYRSFTPELFWSNTSIVDCLFPLNLSFVSQHTVADVRTVLLILPLHCRQCIPHFHPAQECPH